MVEVNNSYDFITEKISDMKNQYSSLRKKSEEYVFSALCIKNNLYKNPALDFNESIIENAIVDGNNDGGVDIIISDPNSETCDLILCQSKHSENNIDYNAASDAIHKLIDFYKLMESGNYERVNKKVQEQFVKLYTETGDESKIIFILYTSSSKNNIREDRLNKIVKEAFNNDDKYELQVYFAKKIEEEIKEAESRRPYVENGKLIIDRAKNVLYYNDSAAIVNVSAFSIKTLYALNGTNLLSNNLRYYIKKKDIDDSIKETITQESETFWYKNNGITIICEEFDISGVELKLKNFSIVNGGQTTYLIHKNEFVNKESDFFLPCKVINTLGNSEDEKNKFNLSISKATNSQKAIKSIDLKANAPEQVRFANSMREAGVFYQTKRGEKTPTEFRDDYKNSDLAAVGKLCLAGIFQLPATSRNKPSTMYTDQYYNMIFDSDQKTVSLITRDLLYVDYYFQKKFNKDFNKKYNGDSFITFANNSRTICLSFICLAARYLCGNILEKDLRLHLEKINLENYYKNHLYSYFKDINKFKGIFNDDYFKSNKDKIDSALFNLFEVLIKNGSIMFQINKKHDTTLNETNYLKNDKNYYEIINFHWNDFKEKIELYKEIFKNAII